MDYVPPLWVYKVNISKPVGENILQMVSNMATVTINQPVIWLTLSVSK